MTICSTVPLLRRTLFMQIPQNITKRHFSTHLPPKLTLTPCDLKDRVITLEKKLEACEEIIKNQKEKRRYEIARLKRSLIVTDIAVFAIFMFSL